MTLPADIELEEVELNLKAGELKAEQILAKDLEVNAGNGYFCSGLRCRVA